MNRVKTTILAAVLSGGFAISGSGGAQAFTLGVNGIAGSEVGRSLVEKTQFRGRRRGFRGRGFRGRSFRGRGFRGRRGRGIGPGAAIGLGILGLGLAAGAAAAAHPPGGYYRQCWYEHRDVYNRWGDYVGTRRVRYCD